jgi:hypothetical protein|uniref:Uncharacterized protein n=1 Tax=Zea mays TaxID=4577 RepID=A0A804QU26_MAIZE
MAEPPPSTSTSDPALPTTATTTSSVPKSSSRPSPRPRGLLDPLAASGAPFLGEMPPFQRPQGAPDRRPTSLGLGHRPAHTRQQQQSDPSCQANSKEEINFVSCRVEGFQTFSRGFRQQPCVRWLQFSARAPRFWSGGFVLSFSLFPLQKISISPRSSIRPRAGSRCFSGFPAPRNRE